MKLKETKGHLTESQLFLLLAQFPLMGIQLSLHGKCSASLRRYSAHSMGFRDTFFGLSMDNRSRGVNMMIKLRTKWDSFLQFLAES